MNKVACGLLLILVLGACGTLPKPESKIGIINYTPLIREGIFITESNSVSFDYTAVGSIIASEKGGWLNGKLQRPSAEVALQNIAKELKRLNANGIINIAITSSIELSSDFPSNTYVPVITIKGMAIKTLENVVKKTHIQDLDILGQIDGIQCKIMKRYNNGMTICTSKELTPEQIKKANSLFLLKGTIKFNLEGFEGKGESYAGIDNGFIIIYKNNEFIKL